MAELVWDKVGDRVYENGLDRGVLYLPDGSGVPWNGLTAIIETFDKANTPVYYEGMKINDLVTLGSFAASMKAVTYPDEFVELEGLVSLRRGFYVADQIPQVFGLCYRTMVGNDVEGDSAGYKIHILYNVTAIPKDKTYATTSTEPSLVEFEWDITAVPEDVPNMHPTAHVIINSRDIDPLLLAELERILYGADYIFASLIPMADLITKINEFLRWEVVDHGDGTWSAITEFDDLLEVTLQGYFEADGINAWHLDQVTYQATSTTGAGDVPRIKIFDLGNGKFTITADDAFLEEVSPGLVEVYEATTVQLTADTYELLDTL